ncbi:MAG TPA: ASCH domain-containing protein [Acholeplasmataceae bacterium]|nr:ASCH domain-containing protein [Acholeplasmataceae bacterium]
MRKILISINPEHVEKILNGTKKYEFRTKAAKQKINSLIIYSTYPTKKVVAEVEIVSILEMKPEDLWNETAQQSGIDKVFYDEYFEDREIAYAYKLGKVDEYEEPMELSDFGINFAPQSFVYVNV